MEKGARKNYIIGLSRKSLKPTVRCRGLVPLLAGLTYLRGPLFLGLGKLATCYDFSALDKSISVA